MSDDFLDEVAAAVENGGSVSVTNDVTENTAPEVEKAPTKSIIDEVNERISPEEKETKPAPKPFKAKRAKAVDAEKAEVDAETQQSETNATQQSETESGTKPKEQSKLFMDRFLGEDAEGNLITPEGTIVALKGDSRRFYEGVKREAREARAAAEKQALTNVELAGKFKELYEAYKEVKESPIHKSITERTGLNTAEVEEAIQIMKTFKESPIEGVKQILTRAQLSGTDLTELGIKGGLSLGTIKEVMEAAVEDKLKAFTKPVTDTPQQQEAKVRSAVGEVQAFMKRHGNSVDQTEIEALTKAKQKFPNKSLDELHFAYVRSQRKKAEEAEATSWKERSVTKDVKPQRQQRIVKTNNPNFATMSFDDIASSILKDI